MGMDIFGRISDCIHIECGVFSSLGNASDFASDFTGYSYYKYYSEKFLKKNVKKASGGLMLLSRGV